MDCRVGEMTEKEFNSGIKLLEVEFGKTMPAETKDQIWRELRWVDGSDWGKAIWTLKKDTRKRTLPRPSEIENMIQMIHSRRREEKYTKEKERERKEIEAIFSDDFTDVNTRRIKKIVEAISKGSSACNELGEKFGREQFVEGLSVKKGGCGHKNCQNGLVPVIQIDGMDRRRWIGRCSKCSVVEGVPYGVPKVDPETGIVIGGNRKQPEM